MLINSGTIGSTLHDQLGTDNSRDVVLDGSEESQEDERHERNLTEESVEKSKSNVKSKKSRKKKKTLSKKRKIQPSTSKDSLHDNIA